MGHGLLAPQGGAREGAAANLGSEQVACLAAVERDGAGQAIGWVELEYTGG